MKHSNFNKGNILVAIKPILWVSQEENIFNSFDTAKSTLSRIYEILDADQLNIDGYQDNESSEHIILIDNNTPDAELLVKAIAWKILSTNSTRPEINIVKLHYPIDTHDAYQIINSIEGNEDKFIESGKKSFKEFCKECNQEEIEPDEIKNHLMKIIKYSPLDEREIQYEILKKRTALKYKHKAFREIVMKLELEFKKELEKRGVSYDSSNSIDAEKEELKLILNEKDKFKKIKFSKEFKKKYGYTNSEFKELIDYFLSEMTSTKCRILDSNEFHSLEIPENKFIYDGILPSVGVTIFSALSGVGKTISSFDLAASLIYNQTFLGIPSNIENRKTIFVNSTGEMSDSEMLEAFVKRGIGKNTDKYKVILDWDMTQWEDLENTVKEERPQLIILDSFRGITAHLNFDENNKDAAKPVRKLQELCNKYQLACILIHHDRKSEDSTNKISKTAGNISITASASCVWNLSKNKDDTLNFEITKIRNSKNKKFVIKLNEDTNSFDLVDCVENIEANTKINPTTLDSIVEFFEKNNNEPKTVREISEFLNLNKDTVRKTFNRHEGIKFIKSIGSQGNKCSPAVYKLKNYCPTVPSNAETIDIQEIEDMGHLIGQLNNDCPTVPPLDKEKIPESVPSTIPPTESIDISDFQDLKGQQDTKDSDIEDNNSDRLNNIPQKKPESIETKISNLTPPQIKVISLFRKQNKLTYEKIIEKLQIKLDNLELVLSELQQKDIIYYSGNIYSLNPEFDNI